jgi:hypothetical protein
VERSANCHKLKYIMSPVSPLSALRSTTTSINDRDTAALLRRTSGEVLAERWPGAPGIDAFFYSYAYPAPPGYATAHVQPAEAAFDSTMGEFLLPYDSLRATPDPESTLLAFLRTTYDAAASLGHWDREALERGR